MNKNTKINIIAINILNYSHQGLLEVIKFISRMQITSLLGQIVFMLTNKMIFFFKGTVMS